MFTSSDTLLNIIFFFGSNFDFAKKYTALSQEKMSSPNYFTKLLRRALQLIIFQRQSVRITNYTVLRR